MPVLVNKGNQPTLAAWLFFSPRSALEELIETIRENALVAGVVNVEPKDGKPKELVEVHLAMASSTSQPDEEPLEGTTQAQREAGPASEREDGPSRDDEGDRAASLIDLVIGSTTCEAARRYLQPREVDGKPWSISMPDLASMADFAESLLGSSPETRWIIWSIDPQGILRMAPAKDAKPMAGNVLRVKL